MFASETYGVTPDVILFAKGIANGMPLGGIIASRSLMDRWPEGSHGTTFGGNPVSCAAALATLSVIEDENLCDRARVAGQRFISELQAVASTKVKEVRGLGLMVGVECVNGEVAEAVQMECLDKGLIVLVCGAGENVLRLVPPLTVSDDEITQGLSILKAALVS